MVVTGVEMLFGRNWARLLCIALGPASLIINWIMPSFRPTDIPSVVAYIAVILWQVILWTVVIFFLTRRDAREFFTGSAVGGTPVV